MTNVALSLQDLAQFLQDYLEDRADEWIGFVLMVQTGNVTQYVSNCTREDGKKLIQKLLERWEKNRADIPAHYNPDLKGVDHEP
jgi:hypothetical protein